MVLCLTYAYVTKVLCFYVTMSSKTVSYCLTQKPHPVRYSLSEEERLGVRRLGLPFGEAFTLLPVHFPLLSFSVLSPFPFPPLSSSPSRKSYHARQLLALRPA